jgi:hypothetical protein
MVLTAYSTGDSGSLIGIRTRYLFLRICERVRDTLMRETTRMTMNMGYRYGCRNPRCGCEIEVTKASKETARNPRCCCGAEMKRPHTKPVLKGLDAQSAALFRIHEEAETTRTR